MRGGGEGGGSRRPGLATDNFSAEATAAYIREVTDRLEAHLGDLRQTALTHLYLPSYEVRGAIWTDDFPEQFTAYRGYDPRPFLPTLNGAVVESREITDRFLFDFRKTLGQLLVDCYYREASAAARRLGLGIEAEAGGPGPPVHQVPVDALAALGALDAMRGEFWPFRPDSRNLWVVKETASAAHIYGHTRVHMEAFTGFRHWQDGPFDLKPSAHRAFCEGMNHVVWHTAAHQPDEGGNPGWVYGAGTHLTPRLVWWPMAKPFIDHLSRCSFLLQQGLFVADVCYYYGAYPARTGHRSRLRSGHAIQGRSRRSKAATHSRAIAASSSISKSNMPASTKSAPLRKA